MQDPQVLFNILVAVSGFLGGYILNNIARSIERVDAEVRGIPKDYVHKDDFHRAISELQSGIARGFDQVERNFAVVFSKLDNKEDKSSAIANRHDK